MTALREKLARALDPDAFGLDGFQRPLVRDAAGRKEDALEKADSTLATIEESGLVIVPREATEEMIDACPLETNEQIVLANWSAMLAAAPKEPTA